MNFAPMTSVQLRNARGSLEGKPVELAGRLLVKTMENLCITLEGDGEVMVIPILDPTFFDRLTDSVPFYVGGGHIYDHAASMLAVLSERGQALTISSVKSGTATNDDGESFTF